MFEKFGEFDSYMEINMAAEGLRDEGDTQSLKELAEENGLQDMVEDYLSGTSEELCDVITAAVGKLEVEKKEATSWAVLANDIVDYLMGNCDDTDFAAAIRKKGKRIEQAAKEIQNEAKKNSVSIPGGQRCSYCGPMRGYQIIKEYYQGSENR